MEPAGKEEKTSEKGMFSHLIDQEFKDVKGHWPKITVFLVFLLCSHL